MGGSSRSRPGLEVLFDGVHSIQEKVAALIRGTDRARSASIQREILSATSEIALAGATSTRPDQGASPQAQECRAHGDCRFRVMLRFWQGLASYRKQQY